MHETRPYELLKCQICINLNVQRSFVHNGLLRKRKYYARSSPECSPPMLDSIVRNLLLAGFFNFLLTCIRWTEKLKYSKHLTWTKTWAHPWARWCRGVGVQNENRARPLWGEGSLLRWRGDLFPLSRTGQYSHKAKGSAGRDLTYFLTQNMGALFSPK